MSIICKICGKNLIGGDGTMDLEDLYNYHANSLWKKNNDAHKFGKPILRVIEDKI